MHLIRGKKKILFEKTWKDNLPPMIVILGDHGMADAGGHGGASLPETLTPVVAIFPPSINDQVVRSSNKPSLIKQHDLASTLVGVTIETYAPSSAPADP